LLSVGGVAGARRGLGANNAKREGEMPVSGFLKKCLPYFLGFCILPFFPFSNHLSLAAECTPYPTGQNSSSLSLDPSGNPHVAWEQVLNTSSPECNQNDIFYTNSADEGMSFFAATADIDRLPNVTQARVSLEVDGEGNPAVAWVDTRNDEKSVYFARSFDGGNTFTAGVRIDSSPQRQDRPCLVFDSNNNPVIAWIEVHYVARYQNPVGYIFVTRSVDGGATFLPSVCVCAKSKPYQGWPALAIDSNNNPMVALHYYGNWNNSWNLFFARSRDMSMVTMAWLWIPRMILISYLMIAEVDVGIFALQDRLTGA
jgi:hypothetical protein